MKYTIQQRTLHNVAAVKAVRVAVLLVGCRRWTNRIRLWTALRQEALVTRLTKGRSADQKQKLDTRRGISGWNRVKQRGIDARSRS